jgi:hypothetical protein
MNLGDKYIYIHTYIERDLGYILCRYFKYVVKTFNKSFNKGGKRNFYPIGLHLLRYLGGNWFRAREMGCLTRI